MGMFEILSRAQNDFVIILLGWVDKWRGKKYGLF
jgi:hypothetical protein